MPVLLDTDVAIEILRGNRFTIDAVANHDGNIFVSSITAAELFYGASHSLHAERNVESVRAFLRQFRRLTLTDEAAMKYGELKEMLQTRATSIGAFDLLIAAIALQNHCVLATGNTRHFSKIDGLSLSNWCKGNIQREGL